MSAQHTPGPWFVVERVQAGPAAFEEGQGCFQIVDNERPDLANTLCSRYRWPERADEMRANARLIAAAPDLLEALREMVAADDWISAATLTDDPGRDGEHAGERMERAIEAARAAIAKAQGGDV